MVELRPRPTHIRHLTTSIDPATLIGKHVTGFLDDYPLQLTLFEHPENPVEIHFLPPGGGRWFEYFIEDHLRSALEAAALDPSKPVKIIDAQVGEVTKRYEVPVNDALPQHNGKIWHDNFTLIGLRLAGMDRVGWIWGEDTDKSWEEFVLYCGTYIPSKEQLETIEQQARDREEAQRRLAEVVERANAANMSGRRGGRA